MDQSTNSIDEDLLRIAGSASWHDFIVSVYNRLEGFSDSSSKKDEIDRVILHELMHYFQFTCTLDGASWYFHGIQCTDSLRSALRGKKGPISIPLLESEDSIFDEAKRRYSNLFADEQLFIYGNPKVYGFNIAPPILKISSDIQIHLTNRFLYEGFARLNERIGITKLKGSKKAASLYENIPFLIEYDWPFLLAEENDTDSITILALIDLALMRPVANWGQYGYTQTMPAWRFIKALNFVRENSISIKLGSVTETQGIICSELGWVNPNDLIREMLPYAKEIRDSLLWNNDRVDPSEVDDEYMRSKVLTGGFCTDIKIEQIVQAFTWRLDSGFSNEIFIVPSGRLDLLNDTFLPKGIVFDNGFANIQSSDDLGLSKYFSEKIKLSNQIMKSDIVTCPIKELNVGECPFDKTCPGKFPRIDRKDPDCPFNKIFNGLFGHSLGEVESCCRF